MTLAAFTVLVNALVARNHGLGRLLELLPFLALGLLGLGLWRWWRARRTATDQGPPVPSADKPREAPTSRAWCWLLVATVAFVESVVLIGPRVLLVWFVTAVLLSFQLYLARRDSEFAGPAPSSNRLREAWVWLLAVAVAIFLLGFPKPAFDDCMYINFAVAVVDRPELPMLRYDTLHAPEGLPLMFSAYRAASFEMLGASLSSWTGLPALHVFHLVLMPLGGLLMVLSGAGLLERLLRAHWWMPLGVWVLLLLCGGSGSMALEEYFLLLQEGKAWFILFLLPYLLVQGLQFGARPTLWNAFLLLCANVAGMGLTANAMYVAPVATMLAVAAAVPWNLAGLRRLTVALGTTAYVLVVGWSFVTENQFRAVESTDGSVTQAIGGLLTGGKVESASVIHNAWMETFGRGRGALLALMVLLLSPFVCRKGAARRLVVILPLATMVFFFGPGTARVVAGFLGSEINERILWILPVPLLLAVLLTSPVLVGRRFLAARVVLALALVASFFQVNHRTDKVLAHTGLSFWSPFRLKVNLSAYRMAEGMIESLPADSYVIVPKELGVVLPMLHNHPYPLVARQYYMKFVKRRVQEGSQLRREATRFVEGGRKAGDGEAFRKALQEFQVAGVVINRAGRQARLCRTILNQEGFELVVAPEGSNLAFWKRKAPP